MGNGFDKISEEHPQHLECHDHGSGDNHNHDDEEEEGHNPLTDEIHAQLSTTQHTCFSAIDRIKAADPDWDALIAAGTEWTD